jgi:protein ImuB
MLVSFFGVDGTVNRLQIGTSRPLHDAARLYHLFTDKFAHTQWDNEFGYDRIRLAAPETELLVPAQKDLTSGEEGPELVHLIDRLTARLGATRVLRFMPQDSHVPEQESVTIPAANAQEFASSSTSPSWGGRNVKRSGWGGQSTQDHQDSLAPARPLRLFEPPERIDAIAEVPDGPPVKFRWRRVAHDVARVEGPERIAMPWWRNAPSPERLSRSTSPTRGEVNLTRDYFRVETRDGARLFLYREGLYGETAHPSWYLHGFLP